MDYLFKNSPKKPKGWNLFDAIQFRRLKKRIIQAVNEGKYFVDRVYYVRYKVRMHLQANGFDVVYAGTFEDEFYKIKWN